MVQLTDSIWAVEVPESWETAELHFQPSIEDMLNDREGFSELIMWYTAKTCGSPRQKLAIKLPATGSYQFLFTTKEATEGNAVSVVQIISNGKVSGRPQYRRYDRDLVKDTPAKCWTRDSRHSLETLLKSKGCDPGKNYAIIQKL